MTFGQLRNQVLKLLNQYSIAGALVAESYNNQQDYLNRIVDLANDAMLEIATTARKIPALVNLADLAVDEREKEVWYELPEDFYQLQSGSIVTTREGATLHTNVYTLRGKNYLLVPKDETGDYSLVYYRYPTLLPEMPEDKTLLDNEPETHSAVAFYVASFLVAQDDSFLCSLFYNKYEDKLSKMGPGVTAEIRPVDDAYRFFG